MVKYRIVHCTGEFSVDVWSNGKNSFAKIFDGHALIKLVVGGRDEEDIYWKCRCWASSNIRGEFCFEPVAEDRVKAKEPVSVAA